MAKIDRVQEVSTELLKPYGNNAKIHGKDQVEKIADSIKAFGFLNPCLIDKDFNVIAGHGRLLAAQLLGMEEIPCIYIEGLTEAERKAYILADNRLGELAEWNMDLVYSELADLDDGGFDVDLTGFDFDLDDDVAYEIQEDDYEEENIPVKSVVGQIWLLGNHRLMCGDSSKEQDMQALFDGNLCKLVFTDPPYGVAIGDKNKFLNSVQPSGRCTENIANDNVSLDELYDILRNAFSLLKSHSADDCSYYVTSPQGGEIGLMMMMMKDAGLEVRHNLIWEKNCATFSMGRLDYDYQHEPIFYTWTKKHNYYGKGKYHTTIWKFDKPRKCDLHPTMKPIELIVEAIMNSSLEGDIVADIFGGSGSTLIACEQTNRICYMMEIDPHYCDVIINRWEQLTGKKAILLESGS